MSKILATNFSRTFGFLRCIRNATAVASYRICQTKGVALFTRKNCHDMALINSHHYRYNHEESSHFLNNKLLYGALAFSLFGFGKKEEINPFNLFVAKAKIAEEKLELTQSSELYHEALKVLSEQYNDKKITEAQFIEKQTVVFNYLSNVSLLQGKVRIGEELMKATLQGMFACGKEQSDNAILEISLKLANIYALQKREAEAIAGYKFCYRILTEKLEKGENDEDTQALLGLTCDNYGRYLLSVNDYIQSEHYFAKALEICQNLNGHAHSQSLLIMNNLATLAVARKDYPKSRKHLEKAVELGKNSKEMDVDVMAAVYCNLAMVYHHESKSSESFLALKEAENLAKMADNDELMKEIEECKKKIGSP